MGHTTRRWILGLDAAFLIIIGLVAMSFDAVGHFLGAGPMAQAHGSPYSIGGFEAHGLAAIIGALLLRAAIKDLQRLWHGLGLVVHLLLGGSNLLFWPSFAQLDAVPMGVVTTVCHAAFVVAHAACLRATRS
jgi:hypothetical protein